MFIARVHINALVKRLSSVVNIPAFDSVHQIGF
jgi:hypothetical protein